MTALDDDAALASSLVREAALLAGKMRAAGVSTSAKENVSDLVTEADHAAEALIRDRLRAERPDDGILGEEGTAIAGTSGRTWVIDPVDGTYNFAAGLDWWGSALVLRSQEDVLLGAVAEPSQQSVVVGGPTLRASRDGVPLPDLVDRSLAHSCVLTYLHPPHYGTAVGDAFTRVVSGAATLRMLGSASRDAVAVATGQMQLLLAHSFAEWDWLPAAALIRSVGGEAVQVEAAGVVWSVAGVPTAVGEAVARLREQ